MRYLIAAAALLFALAAPAFAADLEATCTIPDSAQPKALALCETLRHEMRVPAANWDRHRCATEFMRRGMRRFSRTRAIAAAAVTVNNAEQNDVNDSEANFGEGFTRSFCGDGVADTEFGEACDDGNDLDGDGCETDCTVSP